MRQNLRRIIRTGLMGTRQETHQKRSAMHKLPHRSLRCLEAVECNPNSVSPRSNSNKWRTSSTCNNNKVSVVNILCLLRYARCPQATHASQLADQRNSNRSCFSHTLLKRCTTETFVPLPPPYIFLLVLSRKKQTLLCIPGRCGAVAIYGNVRTTKSIGVGLENYVN